MYDNYIMIANRRRIDLRRVARILADRNQVLGAPLLAFFARGGWQQHPTVRGRPELVRAPASGPNSKKQRPLH